MAAKPSIRAGTRSFAISQALRIVGAFAIATFVARQLGADGKGGLALLQQTPSIMALVMGFGFGGVNVYYVGSGRKSAAEALSDSLLLSALGALIGVPLSFAIMRSIPALSTFPPLLVLASSLIVPVSVLTSQVAGILVGSGRPERQARAQSIGMALNVAVVAVLYLRVQLSISAAIVASLAAAAISLVLMLAAVRERPAFEGWRGRLADAAPYARKRYFTEVAAMLEMRVDIVMLGVLATAAATGVYSVAVSVVELLWFIPRAAETPLLSRFLHERPAVGADLVAITVRLSVLLEIVMLTGAALLLRPTVEFVFGPAFVGAPALFWILAPGIVVNGLTGPVASYLTSQGHQFPGLAAVSVAANIVLNASLIPIMGAAGAALASSLTYGLGGVWLFWKFIDLSGCRPSALFVPRVSDLRAVLGR